MHTVDMFVHIMIIKFYKPLHKVLILYVHSRLTFIFFYILGIHEDVPQSPVNTFISIETTNRTEINQKNTATTELSKMRLSREHDAPKSVLLHDTIESLPILTPLPSPPSPPAPPKQPDVIFKIPTVNRPMKRVVSKQSSISSSSSSRKRQSASLEPPTLSRKKRKTNQSTNPTMNFVTDQDIANITKYFQLPEPVTPIIDDYYVDIGGSGADDDDDDYDGETDLIGFEPFEIECSARKKLSKQLDVEDNLQASTAEPINIPLDPIELAPAIPIVQSVVRSFNQEKFSSIVSMANVKNIEIIDPKRFGHVRKLIECYLVNGTSVQKCIDDVLKLTERPRIICACILEIIEDTNDAYELLDCQRPMPALTRSHQQIILLIKHLSGALPGDFDRFCMSQTERTLFKLSADNNRPLNQTINLVRLYIGLADCTDSSRMRLFVYKCFYYYQSTSTPMVFVALMAHPQCLPRLPIDKNEFAIKFKQFDPLVQTIHILLMNFHRIPHKVGDVKPHLQLPNVGGDAYKKDELQFALWTYYRHENTERKRITYEQLVENLCERLADNRLRNVANAFILLAKRQGWAWAKRCLVDDGGCLRRFLKDLRAMKDEQICVILHTIGSIVKTYPITQDVSGEQRMFVAVLEAASERHCVQEAAISSLLQTARFGLPDVYDRIKNWQPTQPVNRKLWCQLQTFIYRKPQAFWN